MLSNEGGARASGRKGRFLILSTDGGVVGGTGVEGRTRKGSIPTKK